MTSNAAFKKSVRTFAEFNGINYTAALREFDTETHRLLTSVRPVEAGPDRIAEDAWAAERGLRATPADACFHQLASGSGRGGIGHKYEAYQKRCSFQDELSSVMKDHGRAYQFPGSNGGRRRLAVVTFAPYRRWDDAELHAEVQTMATAHDLRFRLGMSKDATYGSGTVPIVFWNPRVVDLS